MTDRSSPEGTDEKRSEERDQPGEDRLDPETRAAFERSYERHKEAMERLAEL